MRTTTLVLTVIGTTATVVAAALTAYLGFRDPPSSSTPISLIAYHGDQPVITIEVAGADSSVFPDSRGFSRLPAHWGGHEVSLRDEKTQKELYRLILPTESFEVLRIQLTKQPDTAD